MEPTNQFEQIKHENEELKKKLKELEEKMKHGMQLNASAPPEYVNPIPPSTNQPSSPIPPPGYGIQTNPPPYNPEANNESRPFVNSAPPAYNTTVVNPIPNNIPPLQVPQNSANSVSPPLTPIPESGIPISNFIQTGVLEFKKASGPIGPVSTEIPFDTLSSGEPGSKFFRRKIPFQKPFAHPPKVVVFISGIDVAVNDDHRINVDCELVDQNGFTLIVSSWGKTIIRQCNVSWFAVDVSLSGIPPLILTGREAFKRGVNNWNLTGSLGDRSHHHSLKFTNPFHDHAPLSFAAFSLVDILNIDDLRITTNVREDHKSKESLVLDISTWLATQVWSTHVSWIAFDQALTTNPPFVQPLGKKLMIQTGRRPFKKGMPQFILCEGTGVRNFSQHVVFPKPFKFAPQVMIAFSGLDLLTVADHRLKCETNSINEKGFNLDVSTWENSMVWSCSVSWIAVGEPHPEVHVAPETKIPANVTPTKVPGNEQDPDSNLCKICFDRRINTVIIPCGHMALCSECSEKIRQDLRGTANCPICKSPFVDIIKTYVA